ncbi:transcriptional regulator [Salinivibrio sp. VYel6]|nr:transcriptional regulator [Salinivibrio sp. VYel6]
MERNDSMCEFRQLKHQSFDDACCAFANRHNLQQLASQSEIRAQVLRNKLNPEQPHQLTARELATLTHVTKDETLVSGLLFDLNMVAAKVPEQGEAASLATRALQASQHAGEISAAALQHGGNHYLPRTERDRLKETAHRGIRNLVMMVSDLENRTSGMTPFLSMAVDAVGSGMPIPGLS